MNLVVRMVPWKAASTKFYKTTVHKTYPRSNPSDPSESQRGDKRLVGMALHSLGQPRYQTRATIWEQTCSYFRNIRNNKRTRADAHTHKLLSTYDISILLCLIMNYIIDVFISVGSSWTIIYQYNVLVCLNYSVTRYEWPLHVADSHAWAQNIVNMKYLKLVRATLQKKSESIS